MDPGYETLFSSSRSQKVLPLQTSSVTTRSSPKVKFGLSPLDLLWEKHAATDAETRLALIEGSIQSDRGQFSIDELKFLDAGKRTLAKWDNNEMVATKLKMKSPLLTATVLHHSKERRTSTPSNGLVDHTVFGTVTCLIRGGSIDEVKFLDAGKRTLAKWDNNEMVVTKLKMKSPLLTATVLHHSKKWRASTPSNGLVDHTVFGTVYCLIRGASIDVLLAYFMDYESMFFQKQEFLKSKLDSKTLEKVNGHHSVLYYKGSLPPPFRIRDFVWSAVWQKQNPKQFILVAHPAHHMDVPPKSDTIRAESLRVLRFTEVKPKVTKFELFFR